MSYYILPKINNRIVLTITESTDELIPCLSHSLFNYYNELTVQIKDTGEDYTDLISIVNPYEYVFSNVHNSKLTVSKRTTNSNLFYDFLEICMTIAIFDSYKLQSIRSLHISSTNDTLDCFEILRENCKDHNTNLNEINTSIIGLTKYHFLFFDSNEGIDKLLKFIMVILKNQSLGGGCIIKINELFYKPMIDILYMLSSLYDKIYILKPNTSNITTFEKYIICKGYGGVTEEELQNNRDNYYNINSFLSSRETHTNKEIISLLNYEVPYYFIVKIYELNIIIGQPQLEALNFILNLIKNKNKEDKIDLMRKSNIIKSVAWCEKYKIPYNKFTEKINIFLPLHQESKKYTVEEGL
jgi:hypothetical protein